MSEVLPVCEAADQVVVYCNGGDCDASERAVQYLANAGIPVQKMFIYVGGITEWKSKSLPVEIGSPKNGSLRSTNP